MGITIEEVNRHGETADRAWYRILSAEPDLAASVHIFPDVNLTEIYDAMTRMERIISTERMRRLARRYRKESSLEAGS